MGGGFFCLILLGSIIINWFFALIIERVNTERVIKKILLIISIVINIGVLFFYKYLSFFESQLLCIVNTNIKLHNIVFPLGISFFTFQALSYVIDVYRGEKCLKNPLNVGLYISFFPQLIAGPIVRYSSIANQINNRSESVSYFKSGIVRFMEGFAKKVLLANSLAVIADKAFEIPNNELTITFAWLGAISYSLQIYFDFSGYSDMAIGLGRMFGFKFEENFNYPYRSVTITEFWRRWHISLSTWFRDYVYIPLGGNRTGNNSKTIRNLLIVWLLTGLWHGANWTFVLWGFLYFIFLLIEKYTTIGDYLKSNPVLGYIYTTIIVIPLWVIFRADSINEAFSYIGTMTGFSSHSKINSGLTYVYLRENIVYLLVAILSASGIFVRVENKLNDIRKVRIKNYVCLCFLFVFFLISIIYVVNGTYNPFIYFNF